MKLLQNIFYCKVVKGCKPRPVAVTPCSEPAGPQVPLPSDPLGLFSLFFDDTLVDLIVKETNRYAEQTLQGTDKE